VPFSTATRMVDWFVDNGYAQRLPDPEDRRVVRVALTDSGRELYQTIERYMVQHFRLMLSPSNGQGAKIFSLRLRRKWLGACMSRNARLSTVCTHMQSVSA